MHTAPDRVAVAQRLVPAELPTVAILPPAASDRLDRLGRHFALAADLQQRLDIFLVGFDFQHREIVGKQHRVECEPFEAAAMHRGNLRAMTGNADKPHEPLRSRFDQSLKRATGSQSGRPFILGDQVVHLDQIYLIDAQALQRTMKTVASALIRAIAGFSGEKKSLAMLVHPRTDSQFRFAVRRRRIDMIDAIFEQHLEHAVRLVLLHPTESGGSENNASTLMPGFSKRTRLDQDVTSPEFL